MKYLLDTHTLLWITREDDQLSPIAREIYLDQHHDIFISMASLWEMSIKISLGKLNVHMPLAEFVKFHVRGNQINILDIKLPHIEQIEILPLHHRDPFDRLIVTQAMVENMPILSRDSHFDLYPVKRVW